MEGNALDQFYHMASGEWARHSKSCILTGYPSQQDGPAFVPTSNSIMTTRLTNSAYILYHDLKRECPYLG